MNMRFNRLFPYLASINAHYRSLGIWFAIGLVITAGFLLLGNAPPIADEGFHVYQIQLFLNGNYSLSPAITVPPVYHAILAAVFKLIGIDAIIVARFISFLGSLGCIYAFNLLAKRISPEDSHLRTVQFIFLPIVFPFLFLIYTDIWALAALLLSIERAMAQRAWQSSLALALAVAMRPPNILWGLLIFAILIGLHRGPPHLDRNCISKHFRAAIPFTLLLGAFSIFLILNHGVSLGDREHQRLAFNISNVWFYLLVFCGLFWPNCLASSKILFARITQKPIPWTAGTSFVFGFYLLTYHISHQYNQPSLWFYLRNRLLYLTTNFSAIKAITFLPIGAGAIGFSLYSFKNQTLARILIPLTFLSILPFPVIEQRYYLVPITLFQLFRKSTLHEEINTVIFITVSAFLTIGISKQLFFL